MFGATPLMSDLTQFVVVRLILRGVRVSCWYFVIGHLFEYFVRGILGTYFNLVQRHGIDHVDNDFVQRRADWRKA
jgi:hypothetical protein